MPAQSFVKINHLFTVALKGPSVYLNCFIRRSFNRRFDARTIVDSTSSIRRSFNRRCDARDRRFDACKTSTLFDAQGGIFKEIKLL